jgi:hypothetical protein
MRLVLSEDASDCGDCGLASDYRVEFEDSSQAVPLCRDCVEALSWHLDHLDEVDE